MHRLSLKRLVVLLSTFGLVFGFMPSASAHKGTHTQSVVTSDTLTWPERDKHGLTSFDLDRPPGPADLSLDIRATGGLPASENLLNGCRLKGGNSGDGLPVGTIWRAPSHELCFFFEELAIEAVGRWEDTDHATDLSCIASGTTSGSGGSGVPFGSFYGEFTCEGNEVASGQPLAFVPSADGHFHGISAAGGLEISFLGEVHCTVGSDDHVRVIGAPGGVDCPELEGSHHPGGNYGAPTPKPPSSPDPDRPLLLAADEARVKHTLACKGNVDLLELAHKTWPTLTPKTMGNPEDIAEATVLSQYYAEGNTNMVPNTLTRAAVALECLIV